MCYQTESVLQFLADQIIALEGNKTEFTLKLNSNSIRPNSTAHVDSPTHLLDRWAHIQRASHCHTSSPLGQEQGCFYKTITTALFHLLASLPQVLNENVVTFLYHATVLPFSSLKLDNAFKQ